MLDTKQTVKWIIPSGKSGFYGGQINGVIGDLSLENLDFILDILDRYIYLSEEVRNEQNICNTRCAFKTVDT